MVPNKSPQRALTHTDTVFFNSITTETRKVDFYSADAHTGKARGKIASKEDENGFRIVM